MLDCDGASGLEVVKEMRRVKLETMDEQPIYLFPRSRADQSSVDVQIVPCHYAVPSREAQLVSRQIKQRLLSRSNGL